MQTELYRCFDAEGALLYVGITISVPQRTPQHRRGSSWFDRVTRIEIERFPTRQEAEEAEVRAINAEGPAHNKAMRRAPDAGICKRCPRVYAYAPDGITEAHKAFWGARPYFTVGRGRYALSRIIRDPIAGDTVVMIGAVLDGPYQQKLIEKGVEVIALDKAAEIMGHPVTANMLNKHLGPRSKPRPWINAKEPEA